MRTERVQPVLLLLAVAVAAAIGAAPVSRAQESLEEVPERARNLDPEQKLGARVPLDLELVDDRGRPVTLGEHFEPDRPVILAMGYYDCPLLCSVLFEGLAKGLAPLDFEAGEDFQVVVVSFDPSNTTEEAAARKRAALSVYAHEGAESGWAFHTTGEANSSALADAVGYKYRPIEGTKEYAHGAVIMVLTPDGTVARYIFGLDFKPRDLRLALLEASDGKIAQSVGDYFLHLCYRWDPDSEGYALAAFQVMRIGAAGGAVLLGGLIVWLKLGERRRARRASEGHDAGGAEAAGAMGRT